jgi:hypothetical protein
VLGWKAEKKMTDVVDLLVDAALRRCAAEGDGKPKGAAKCNAIRRKA